MNAEAEALLKARIKKHEGRRFTPYRDSVGVLTIGYGHNLEAKPLSQRVIDLIFEDDYHDALMDAYRVPGFKSLNDARQAVIIEMVFNLGLPTLMEFNNTIAAINRGDFNKAAEEMLDSKWAHQVGQRSVHLAEIMRTGVHP